MEKTPEFLDAEAKLNAREAALNEDLSVLRDALLKTEGERMNINREMRNLYATLD